MASEPVKTFIFFFNEETINKYINKIALYAHQNVSNEKRTEQFQMFVEFSVSLEISIKDKYLHYGLALPLQKYVGYIFTQRHEECS